MSRAEGKSKVAVAMSGGVSSAIAAALLKSEGHDVLGVHFNFASGDMPSVCSAGAGEEAARELARRLEIPLHVEDVSEEFEAKVTDFFVHETLQARRPLLCVSCMQEVLFPALERFAQANRCDKVATGHHATAALDPATGQGRITRGMDQSLDQSFWLYGISREIASRLILPVGGLPTALIEKLVKQFDLRLSAEPSACRGTGNCLKDAQAGKTLLSLRAPQSFLQHGSVRTVDGGLIGDHSGLFDFVVGDLYSEANAAEERPALYVVSIDVRGNFLVVGREDQLMRSEFLAHRVRWLRPVIGLKGFDCEVCIGPGQKPVKCRVMCFEAGVVRVGLAQSVRAPQLGESIVFYEGDEVLGGGVIERTFA